VTQVWLEVLKLDQVSVHDNFFELGGHSLLATRVVAHLRSNLHIELPVRDLFESPTVATLAERIDHLRRNPHNLSTPPIIPVLRDRLIPLSFSQRRLWFLEKLDTGSTAYNMPATFEIKGVLNIPALEKALNEIINRHEVLRTRIVEVDGQPYQEIEPNVAFTLPVINLSYLPEHHRSVEVQRLAAEDALSRYHLGVAPLMRTTLLQLSDHDHVLILNFHHIVSDGSSLVVFYRDLATLYRSFLEGKASPLTPLLVQYADYATWQNKLLQSPAVDLQLEYWMRQLGPSLSPIDLPTDYERTSAQSYHGARQTIMLSEELTTSLKELGRGANTTIFMTLLASLNVLLSRYTGRFDVTVGATVAGRNRPEIENLIGFFINVLALRMQIFPDRSFLEFLREVREVCLDAYTHQDLPFEKVVEAINPQRELSMQPLFQVLVNLADVSERVLDLPGCDIVKRSLFVPAAKYDIALSAPEIDGKILLNIVYNAELFCESRMAAMLDQLVYLLSQVAVNPHKKLDQLSLLAVSSHPVLPDPKGPLDDTWKESIYTTVNKHAKQGCDRMAVIDGHDNWTYKELDLASNQLANFLMTKGIKSKDVIAIYAHRSSSLVLALLSVLKAGAIFTILDPTYPPQRLIQYLRISQPQGWLQMEPAGELPEDLGNFVETLNPCCKINLPEYKYKINEFLRNHSEMDTGVFVQRDDPAYIAFTSGSTGNPKGVLCRHGPMTHFLPWQEKTFALVPDDRFCLLSGLAYNYLQREIFTALWLGATVYIPAPELIKSPNRLASWLHENNITVLHLTPAFGELLGKSATERLPAIRRIFSGGDALTKRTLSTMRAFAPNAKIVNLYGATETQRACGYFEIPSDFMDENSRAKNLIPIGRGAENVQLLLLTSSRQLAGVGEVGELFVRSPHLAQGYLGDEKRTQEMFITNPFTNDPADRLYKTGELGRYLPDGNVEWVGRNDRRVNIRGFRVELEEVESILKQHPTIKDAAVVLKEFNESESDPKPVVSQAEGSEIGNLEASKNPKSAIQHPKSYRQLVAYIVSTEQDSRSLHDLLFSYVSTRLPDYMAPAEFVVMEQLPLSPNGKLDYQALPAVQQLRSDISISSPAPKNDIEAKLCDIFARVLGRDKVGVDDNFFRIGGHSLLAAQAAARVRESIGINIDLRWFFEVPTVAGLAKQIEVRLKPDRKASSTADSEREEIEI
jgi:amino acid adenylation domain-containing protein